ncbi:MAG: SRPBCC domain-containing protein [Proteobacteria bacterium]|nr:MAG: SRPBCC domain-containing protein [Pseudomonadota bacterium]
MTTDEFKGPSADIVVEEVFPNSPETVWKALTSGEMIGRWLMKPSGFEAVSGAVFTFSTKPAGEWDGTIHCEVIEVIPNQKLSYSWKGGHDSNSGYGSPLDTVVTWTLSRESNGTRVRLVHSGFDSQRNESALKTMGEGWKKVVPNISKLINEGT